MPVKLNYPSLNGLRAISILLVIIHHLAIISKIFAEYLEIKWLSPFIHFLQDGQLGVNVFFVISGFLITSLMLQEEAATKSISLKKFYIRRILRIFPAYYFLLFVYYFLCQVKYIEVNPASWLTSMIYIKYLNWDLEWITAHLWSLSLEENFYLLWPFVFMAGEKVRKNIALSIVLIVPLIRMAIHFYPVSWMDDLSPFTRIDGIVTGCICALFKDVLIEKMSPHWTKLFYFSIVYILALEYFSISGNNSIEFISVPFGLTFGTTANLLIAVILMYSVFGPQGRWFKFLNLKPVSFVGQLSYSLYLWQQIFISWIGFRATTFPQNLLFLLLAALTSYYLIEKPFIKLKTRYR